MSVHRPWVRPARARGQVSAEGGVGATQTGHIMSFGRARPGCRGNRLGAQRDPAGLSSARRLLPASGGPPLVQPGGGVLARMVEMGSTLHPR